LKAGGIELDMPGTLLEDIDSIVNMPVPKVHIMTRYTGAVRNQWGLIPTDMRLRMHYIGLRPSSKTCSWSCRDRSW
jgi:uncharacterized protein (DUF362 family)